MKRVSSCPNCDSSQLYESKEVRSGGGHAPDYLPGLGSFFASAKFTVVLCKECGLTRFFARPEGLAKLTESAKWQRVSLVRSER